MIYKLVGADGTHWDIRTHRYGRSAVCYIGEVDPDGEWREKMGEFHACSAVVAMLDIALSDFKVEEEERGGGGGGARRGGECHACSAEVAMLDIALSDFKVEEE